MGRLERRVHLHTLLEPFLVDLGQHWFRADRHRHRRHRMGILLFAVSGVQVIRQVVLNGVRARLRTGDLFSLQILFVVGGADETRATHDSAGSPLEAVLGDLDVRFDRIQQTAAGQHVGVRDGGSGDHRRRVRMLLDVQLHRFLGAEGLVADSALVNLLAVVRHLVELEHVVVAEGLLADVADVGLLAGVGARMHLQLLGAGEALLTRLAHVRLLAGVRAHVYHELAALYERLGAHGAHVRSLAGVDAHVTVELAAVLERAFAYVALVRPFLGVDAPVHAQVLLHRERLLAELALERLLAGVRAEVAGESRRHRERLTADVAAIRILTLFAVGPQVALVHALLRKPLLTEETLVLATGLRDRRADGLRAATWRGEHGEIRAAHQILHRIRRLEAGGGRHAARHRHRRWIRHGFRLIIAQHR